MRKYAILTALALVLALLLVAMTAPPASAGIVNKDLETFPTNIYLADNLIFYLGTGHDFEIYYDETTLDLLVIDAAAAAGGVYFGTGNVFIGDASFNQTADGEDLQVEGFVEALGIVYAYGGVKVDDDTTICWGAGDDVCLEYDEDGTDQGRLTGAMIYEDAQEYDGAAQFDSTVALNGIATFADDIKLQFGAGPDGSIEYDEDGTDQVRAVGSWIWEGAQEYDSTAQFDGVATFTAEPVFNVGAAMLDDQSLTFGTGDDATIQWVDSASMLTIDATTVGFGGNVSIIDDQLLTLGTDLDFTIGYDETTDNRAEFVGPMAFDTGTAASLPIVTNSKAHHTITAPVGYLSATEVQTAYPFSAFTSAGIEGGGQAVIGSADAFISLGDAADYLRLGLTVPETAITGSAAADFVLEFDLIEDTDEECNIDVLIYEYGTGAAVITDTIVMANGAARAWVGLTTLATGQGAVLDPGKFYLIEITATADTDNFKIYGARATFTRGVANNAS